ncbi:MAG: hypothetical protein R2883_01625 [Caldisericia bacterium]
MMGVIHLYKINTETMAEEWSSVVTDSYPYFSSPMICDNEIYYGNNDERFFCLSENSGGNYLVIKNKTPIRCSSAPVKMGKQIIFPNTR